ncbi:MAG: hypothetical protein ACYCTE_16145 [Acidimicrobiales bacterium]
MDEGDVVRALVALERRWPVGLGLYSMDGVLVLVRVSPERDVAPDDVVASFPRIPSDGGGW